MKLTKIRILFSDNLYLYTRYYSVSLYIQCFLQSSFKLIMTFVFLILILSQVQLRRQLRISNKE